MNNQEFLDYIKQYKEPNESFIYKWIHPILNLKYVGSHFGSIDDNYIGSGKYFRRQLEENPIEEWNRIILAYCTKEEQFELEDKFLKFYNVSNDSTFLNIRGSDNTGSIGQRAPLSINEIQLIKNYLSSKNDQKSIRDLAIISFALDTMLRSIDLLKLKVSDISDNDWNLKNIIEIKQKNREVNVEISENTMKSVIRWIETSDKGLDDFLWTGFTHTSKKKPISRVSYGRIIKDRISEILDLDEELYNTHSLRRSKALLIYERTGNIELVRQLLGHSTIAATASYLFGDKKVDSKDILKIARDVISI